MDDPDFLPPATDAETGVALDKPEGLPLNHRLRAEALVAKGEATDPNGEITDEFIAATAERLDAEKAGAEADAADAPEDADPLKTIPILTDHVAAVEDLAELAALRAREVGGKNRAGALDVIDARIAALSKTAGTGGQIENEE